MSNNSSAFTLIELLLVITLLVVILAFTIPIGWSFVTRNDLDVSATITAQTLRRAQGLSQINAGNSGWGVEVAGNQITLFMGGSFAARNQDDDEVFDLPLTLNVSGNSEVDFAGLSGQPAAAANIVLSDSLNQSRTVSVNAVGAVSY